MRALSCEKLDRMRQLAALRGRPQNQTAAHGEEKVGSWYRRRGDQTRSGCFVPFSFVLLALCPSPPDSGPETSALRNLYNSVLPKFPPHFFRRDSKERSFRFSKTGIHTHKLEKKKGRLPVEFHIIIIISLRFLIPWASLQIYLAPARWIRRKGRREMRRVWH